jgi:WD40 repeat protein
MENLIVPTSLGLSTHADRPFTFASSSRDTSLRLWDLDSDEDIFTAIRLVSFLTIPNGLQK